jgi:hypothetical protein
MRSNQRFDQGLSRFGFRAGAATPSGVMISLRPTGASEDWDADGQHLHIRARVCDHCPVASIMMLRSVSSEAALRA